jgi:hypothetical protein
MCFICCKFVYGNVKRKMSKQISVEIPFKQMKILKKDKVCTSTYYFFFHSYSLLVTYLLLTILTILTTYYTYYSLLVLTIYSLQLTTNHLTLTTYHLFITNHFPLLPIIAHHNQSLPIITNHRRKCTSTYFFFFHSYLLYYTYYSLGLCGVGGSDLGTTSPNSCNPKLLLAGHACLGCLNFALLADCPVG